MNEDDIIEDVVVEKRVYRRDLSTFEKEQIISNLLVYCKLTENGYTLARGIVKDVAVKLSVSQATVSRVWKEAKKNKEDPEVDAFVCNSKKRERLWQGSSGILRLLRKRSNYCHPKSAEHRNH